jgi:hypothetical protein
MQSGTGDIKLQNRSATSWFGRSGRELRVRLGDRQR